MTVTFTQLPEHQLPNKQFSLTFGSLTGNFVRVMVTAAPPDSSYAQQIVELETDELEIGTAPTDVVWTGFEPDVPGKYTLKLYEIGVGATQYGGYYAGDPDGWATQTIIDTTTAYLYAGQKLTADVGVGADTATLSLHVWDDTVRKTTAVLHGESSPSVTDPATSKAETFASSSTVATALANLIDQSSTTLVDDPSSILDNIITNFTAHLSQAGVHAANDTDNIPSADLKNASNPTQITRSVGELLTLMTQHMNNDAGDGTGIGGAGYHSVADRANGTIVQSPADYLQSTIAITDMWRAYEAHRVDTTYHVSADITNALTALPSNSLYGVYKAVVDVLATPDPTAPATDNEGATELVHTGGMTKA